MTYYEIVAEPESFAATVAVGDTFDFINHHREITHYRVIKAGPKMVHAEREGGHFSGQVDKWYRDTLARIDSQGCFQNHEQA